MNEKFTPGPWKAGRNKAFSTVLDWEEGKAIYAGEIYHVGWANARNENGEIDLERAVANAVLMGAAPELLASLEEALELIEDVVYGGCVVSKEHVARAHAVREKGYAALAKARGER